MKNTSLITYAAAHMLVDFACGYILYSMYTEGAIETESVAFLFLLYNLLAFATQHAFGALADKVRSNGRIFAVVGITATALGLFVGAENPTLTVCIIGLGNACFHVGGGIDSICESRGMARAGIFVSTGALGIALGCKFGEKLFLSPIHFAALLIFAAVAVWVFCKGERHSVKVPEPIENSKTKIPPKAIVSSALPVLILLFFAILIRSYAGFAAIRPESDSSLILLLIAAASFAGKLAGGILADLLGARRVATVSLLLCVPLFYLGAESNLFFLAATLFFNIAMPITLVGAARKLQGHEGFVFGLTTLALFIGYFIDTVLAIETSTATVIIPLLSLIAAVAVFLTTDDVRVPVKK
ncbi:MAG: hypothetical protein IJD70_09990 [Clostridia bacterium]|nr:hypothetical protein [Clostridia bacterium]